LASGIEEFIMRHLARYVGVALATILVAGFLPAVASAHEHRDVDGGKYSLVVGFLDEPPITGFKNGLDLRVSANTGATPATGSVEDASGTPVEGLESTLQAEIIYGDQKMALTLEPRYNTPGAYNAYVIPMAAGDYTFHIFGTINGDAVDENFTSSPEGFSSVIDATTLQFPQQSAQQRGVVAGTIASGDSGGTETGILLAGFLAGLAIGAVGMFLTRRGIGLHRPVFAAEGIHAGAGD
jgi:hypothetical protein